MKIFQVYLFLILFTFSLGFAQPLEVVFHNGNNTLKVCDAAVLNCNVNFPSVNKSFKIDRQFIENLDLGMNKYIQYSIDCIPGVSFSELTYEISQNQVLDSVSLAVNLKSNFEYLWTPKDKVMSIDLGVDFKNDHVEIWISNDSGIIGKKGLLNVSGKYCFIDISSWIVALSSSESFDLKLIANGKVLGKIDFKTELIQEHEDQFVTLNAQEVYFDCANESSHLLFEANIQPISYPANIIWSIYDTENGFLLDNITQQVKSDEDFVGIEVQMNSFYQLEISVLDACNRVGNAQYLVYCTLDDDKATIMFENLNTGDSAF